MNCLMSILNFCGVFFPSSHPKEITQRDVVKQSKSEMSDIDLTQECTLRCWLEVLEY